jgi:hypothetical protein
VKNTHTRGRTWYLLLSEQIYFIPATRTNRYQGYKAQCSLSTINRNFIEQKFVFVEAPYRGKISPCGLIDCVTSWLFDNIMTCLRHATIVEAQKSVNTLRNNRGSGVYSVPFRAALHPPCESGTAQGNRHREKPHKKMSAEKLTQQGHKEPTH